MEAELREIRAVLSRLAPSEKVAQDIMSQRASVATVASVFGLLVTGCGSSSDPNVVTQTVVQRPAAPTTTEATTETDAPATAPEPTAKQVTVPDVVGENHQDAQDKMQSLGLYNLREKDATGLDRLLIVDSNWQVVSQKPAAGKRVGENTVVTLSSKKIGE